MTGALVFSQLRMSKQLLLLTSEPSTVIDMEEIYWSLDGTNDLSWSLSTMDTSCLKPYRHVTGPFGWTGRKSKNLSVTK